MSDDFDLPPALKAAEPSQTKQWKPRSRPRALPSHTQLDEGSQLEQADVGIKEGIPPIVSDATMTGTDSPPPRSLPRGSSRDRSAEQEGVGDVSLFAAFADYAYDDEDGEIYLPPPLKPVEADPPVKQATIIEEVAPATPEAVGRASKSKEAISESARNETVVESPEASGSGGRRRFRPAEETYSAKSASSNVPPKASTHERSPEQEDPLPENAEPVAPKVSKFFDKSGKRKRSDKTREETPVQEIDASASKQSDRRSAVKASGSGRKKDVIGKGKRRIIQSDEEEEEEHQIEPCPICGNKFPMSAQFAHQTACYEEQASNDQPEATVGSSPGRNIAAAQDAPVNARKDDRAKLQPFRPTNPPVPPREEASVRKTRRTIESNDHNRRQSTTEPMSSPRNGGGTSARITRSAQSRQTRSRPAPEVITLDEDEDEIADAGDSDVEVMPQNRLTRAEKGKGRQRDDSPPPGSIFISKLPAAIKQGYYRMLKRDDRGKVLLDPEDQVERPATGARIAANWHITQEKERKKPPAKGKTWGAGGAGGFRRRGGGRRAGTRRTRK